MSKIRIHELAKELGVDNKIVIARARELGLAGKTSHSNSLEADEADQIRRAVIRQAIGSSPESEIVKTRVDKVTGATQSIVESRKGNVIRRRKHDSPEAGLMEAAPEVVQETIRGVEIAELEEPDTTGTEVVTNGASHARALVEEEIEEAKEIEPAPTEVATVPIEDDKKVGPKILGKIELPRTTKPEVRRPAVQAAEVERSEPKEVEDGEKRAKDLKKKTKKREFSRGDLLDYEGAPTRRVRIPRNVRAREEVLEKKTADVAARPKASKRVVKMDETVSVGELAKQMSLKVGEVIAKLMELGVMATINQMIDKDTATIISEEFGFQIESTGYDESVVLEEEVQGDTGTLVARAPVVTVMGHVDHGKTSLLDAIRNTSVANKEHGGITQHIGAYRCILPDGRAISFIDTPGHAAFTSMRARGAMVTDLVVLVVAADDGVMPQTIEAINHAKAATVPVIVAINKIDKPGGNVERIKKELAQHGLQPEDWGGDVMFYQVSALKGQGIKELLEGILLQAEVKELKANIDRRAKGTIIEARQDRGRGTVATVLVQDGTLRIGDVYVAGSASGRVRSMRNEEGDELKEAGPSVPVEITGLDGSPSPGDDFAVVESEAKAREVAHNRALKKAEKEKRALGVGLISLEEFARRANNLSSAELNVILKADVQGSVEAVKDSIEKISNDKVRVKVLHSGVGGINESDVQLALASQAIIVGFGVRAEPRAMAEAENHGIQLRFYRIIYELIDDVKKAMAGLLEPVRQEVSIGRAEVRQTFSVPKMGTIAGCYVSDGVIKRGALLRLLRDSKTIYEGKMGSLRRFKDDVREVQSGYECGIGIEGFNDIKGGDMIEAYEIKETAATID